MGFVKVLVLNPTLNNDAIEMSILILSLAFFIILISVSRGWMMDEKRKKVLPVLFTAGLHAHRSGHSTIRDMNIRHAIEIDSSSLLASVVVT